MTTNYKFRRATHDRDTGQYLEIFREPSCFQDMVWKHHGGFCHMLSSEKGMTFQELLDEIRKDDCNYNYGPPDLEHWQGGGMLPTPEKVAFSLVRLLEAGYVEMIPSEEK